MLNLDESLDKTVYIFCPEHRIIHYCYHFDYVFKAEKIIFLKNFEEIKNDNVILFIDQNLLKDFLNLNISKILIYLLYCGMETLITKITIKIY